MNLSSSTSVFLAVALLVIAAAVTAALSAGPAVSVTTTLGQTSAYATSADGLRLTLQMSGSGIGRGGSVTINVTETNTNAKALNESAGHDWAVNGLRMSFCYASVYPFGVAVYEGHQSPSSLSTAVRLNIYPLVACPLFIRYVSGYYFSPVGSSAVVLPGSGPPLPMTSGVVVSGNYTAGNSRTPLSPGEYTVVAGDEWGTVVLLYFTVQ